MAPPIPFNKPFLVGKELDYIAQALAFGNLGGDGHFTRACAQLLERRFGISCVLMTPSCTASLELAATLCGLRRKSGDGDGAFRAVGDGVAYSCLQALRRR